MTYYFIIDCDERGEFAAHVEDEDGEDVAGWDKEDCDEGFPPIVDGFMKNLDDMTGLAQSIWHCHAHHFTIQKGRP